MLLGSVVEWAPRANGRTGGVADGAPCAARAAARADERRGRGRAPADRRRCHTRLTGAVASQVAGPWPVPARACVVSRRLLRTLLMQLWLRRAVAEGAPTGG